MIAKKAALFVLKIVFLTIYLFICNAIAALISGLGSLNSGGMMLTDTLVQLVVCAFQVLVLSYPIVYSRWTGWRLVVTIFFAFFGVTTFLSQIETIVFLDYLVNIVPADMIPKMIMQGAITAAMYAPLAVLVHGKLSAGHEPQEPNFRLDMPWITWVWKLTLIAVLYIVIYLAFGMLVPVLAGDAFQTYYAGLQMPVWIFPFQAFRALIWVGLALPVIRMMQSQWWQAGLAVASLFSVLMGVQLLLPNEFMPEAIRMAHFVEIMSSNFLFGWIVVRLLSRPKQESEMKNKLSHTNRRKLHRL
jgi:hypothetical protein